jgi:hypothetical protein
MSEQLQRLHLRHDLVKFNTPSAKDQSRVVRDVQYIHDPSTMEVGRAFRTAFWHHFDLRARPHGNAYALFGANMSRDDMDREVTVMMYKLELPGQAAGWAALQLYREKATSIRLPHLDVVDPQTDTGYKALTRLAALRNEAKDEAATSVFRPNGGLSIAPMGEEMPSEVRAYNKKHQSLPGILHIIKAGYDELYPEANTSEAVAGIVGATNLEDFTDAWQTAAELEPVAAARTLIESRIFIANQ